MHISLPEIVRVWITLVIYLHWGGGMCGLAITFTTSPHGKSQCQERVGSIWGGSRPRGALLGFLEKLSIEVILQSTLVEYRRIVVTFGGFSRDGRQRRHLLLGMYKYVLTSPPACHDTSPSTTARATSQVPLPHPEFTFRFS